jgi:hypothetical protein
MMVESGSGFYWNVGGFVSSEEVKSCGDVSSLEEFLRGFATFGMIVNVIEYMVHKA